MSQINRVPFGLQDLLGATNQGNNPSQMAEVVAPTLDLFQFLAGERFTWFLGNTVNVANNQELARREVQPGELWLLDAVGLRIDPGTTTVGNVTRWTSSTIDMPNTNNPQLTQPLADLGEYEVQAIGGLPFFLNYSFPTLLPMPAGQIIAWNVDGNFAVADDYAVRPALRYYRLNI